MPMALSKASKFSRVSVGSLSRMNIPGTDEDNPGKLLQINS